MKRLWGSTTFVLCAACAVGLAGQTAWCDDGPTVEQLRQEMLRLQRTISGQQESAKQQEARLKELEEQLDERIEALERASEHLAPGEFQLPAWLDNTEWSGDLRLRYEYYDRERTGRDDDDRHRERIRFRYGFTYQFDEKTEIGARFVTGNEDPTSTNQSLDNTFGNKQVFFDRVYVKYAPLKWMTVYGGKFANPFLRTNLIWDSDVQPEGLVQRVRVQTTENVTLFGNFGALVLEEISNDHDPYALVGQVGCEGTLSEDAKVTLAAGYYDFSHVNETALTFADQGNTRVDRDGDGTAESLLYDYDLLDLYGDVKFKLGSLPVKLYGNYINNVAVGDDDSGLRAGLQLGNKKSKGDWLVEYAYRALDREATLDALTDGTFHNGGTNCKGHIVKASYMLGDSWSLAVTSFLAEEEEGASYDHDTVLVDMAWKF